MENAGLITYAQSIMLCDPARDSIDRQRDMPGHRARDGASVVRRSGDHRLVGRYLAQRSVRLLDGAKVMAIGSRSGTP